MSRRVRPTTVTESPKGEFGIYLGPRMERTAPIDAKSERPGSPFCKQPMSTRRHMLADVCAIIGSLDVVFGEIDR